MRAATGLFLAAVLLSGCEGAYFTIGDDTGVVPGTYRPADYKNDTTWADLNSRLLIYGRAALPGALDSYWKLYFRNSKKSPSSYGHREVFLPDYFIKMASHNLMDFVLAHEVAHDVLDHTI